MSVLGDLHLEPAQMHLFYEARQQLVQAMSSADDGVVLHGARVVQLGDLGGYKHRPGWYRGSAALSAHPGTSLQGCTLQAADTGLGLLSFTAIEFLGLFRPDDNYTSSQLFYCIMSYVRFTNIWL